MRGAMGRRTFGWGRVEILAALVNGITLLGLGIGIAIDAMGRIGNPPDVRAPGVILFGLAGVAVNGAAVVALLRAGTRRDDINLRGALRHTIADVAGSAGVVVAGVLVAAFGWNAADPVIALLVAALCIVSARGLIAEPVRILLERAPAHLDPEAIGLALCGVEGVREVHDVHAWTITSGFDAVSVHVIAAPGTDQHALLHRLEEVLREQFGVGHTTIQVDRDHSAPLSIHRKGCPEAPKPRTAAPRLHEHNH
ncbi:MAG: cobalt-zinc-cadmium efflux system protein [Gaiellales bacterium]|jgi:cobalt-zinc-cadmium efflux system protein|nr:cobalt-zinc-cadmium efflux system protein [Gaiellales bacterium]